ncbi:uncharacterized protein BO80DRAFT_442290 [Aspergillus ibericus CBS 121593]|uniref:Caspase domain-containing protein n=1 Tax=Aspergillus ibericus CBS 121593 TaxID=1448316 RepID=A0A395H9X9_9EURO|nr:hypothetical protein BO80DRAFT_442290 [Aspergillus ibericus CBS 121593]RAL03708.1 hypothetical protein BO80DRAFT_442290 [Aspergillus ibericus CBS 121593]
MSASKWAILIGVEPSADSESDSDDDEEEEEEDPLDVCGADVDRMRGFLLHTMKFPEQNVYTLVSSATDPSTLPTYANILRAFEAVTARATAGDVVYVYFSGSSLEIYTTRGLDQGRREKEEYFAILDSNSKEGFLHELELAVLVNRLTRKELDVTVVLDTRGAYGYCEEKHRFRESEFPEEELLSVFHGFWCPRRLDTILQNPNSGAPYLLLWSKYSNRYSRQESLYRDPRSKTYHGFLTYWILRLLEKHGLDMTWNELVRQIGLETHWLQSRRPDAIRIRVKSCGNTERLFLEGCDERHELTPVLNYQARLTKVGSECSLILHAGSAHGVAAGARVQFIPTDDELSHSIPADLFVVDDIRPLSSSARPVTPFKVDATSAKEVRGSATLLDRHSHGLDAQSANDQIELYRSRLGLSGNCTDLMDQVKIFPVGGYRYDNGSQKPNHRSPTVGPDGCLHLLTGDYATVILSNTCQETIYLNILSFDSAFGIAHLSPKTYHESLSTLARGQLACHLTFDIRLFLPHARLLDTQTSSAVAYVKVIVTNKPTSFHAFALNAMRDTTSVSECRDRIPAIPTSSVAYHDPGFLEAYSQHPGADPTNDTPVDEKWCCWDIKFIIHRTPESLAVV